MTVPANVKIVSDMLMYSLYSVQYFYILLNFSQSVL